ncbi:MAG: hypothetical protein ACOC9O_04355 [Myxococcota bacterium]
MRIPGLVVAGGLSAALCAVLAVQARAAEEERPIDPIVAVSNGDPLELGRFVERHGDRYVVARLGDGHPVDTRLAAVRATPWLDAPERVLDPLSGMAAGRDPHLAPAAAWAAYRITSDLDGIAASQREVMWPALASALRNLRRLADDGTARRDLRRVAAFAADALAQLDPSAGDGAKAP